MVRVSGTDLPPPSLSCVFPAGHWHHVRAHVIPRSSNSEPTDGCDRTYRLLDTTHAALIIASTWDYFVLNFGNEDVVDKIPM
jgi:hypothetical protein